MNPITNAFGRLGVRVAIVLMGLSVVLVSMTIPASAHGGLVDIEVISTVVDGASVTYVVSLTYEADGHPVENEPVSLTAVPATGGDPVTIDLMGADGPGRFTGTATLTPGDWTVTFATEDGELTISQPIAEPAPPSGDPSAPSSVLAPSTTVPATSTSAPTASTSGGDSNSGTMLIVVIVAALADLVRRTQADFWRHCTVLGSPGEEADLVQETFLPEVH